MQDSDVFVVDGLDGEKTLSGSIAVAGAKNEVLKTMAASILFEDTLSIANVPDIEDVARMSELLTDLGAEVSRESAHALSIDTRNLTGTALTSDIANRMRASVVLTGPILARAGAVSFPHPGGCVIGVRPIDLFFESYQKMGAEVTVADGCYQIRAPHGLVGAEIFFKVVSVTATEAAMLAATRAQGVTVLKNAATEPEIAHLAEFLNTCGARIAGAGTNTITITGTGPLLAAGRVHTTIPDRIETGSFLILGALAAEQLTIERCEPRHVEIVTALLRDAGVPIAIGEDSITIAGNRAPNSTFCSFNIRTHEYPGLATDIQSPMVVFLTQASGESTVFETIFENRLGWTQDLVRMGASITMMNPQQVLVKGPTPLHGREVEGPDLRAGLAFLLAATIARGTSTIRNAYFIDRGYEHIEARLAAIGVAIRREPGRCG